MNRSRGRHREERLLCPGKRSHEYDEIEQAAIGEEAMMRFG
jgi:hypothetical protein